MIDKELAFSSATNLLNLIKTKQLSPVYLVELYFKRIYEFNPKLNSYITLTYSKAIEAARIAEKSIIDGGKLGRKQTSVYCGLGLTLFPILVTR